jgi:LmbE family N-acetylglucosaminyl deacetylase
MVTRPVPDKHSVPDKHPVPGQHPIDAPGTDERDWAAWPPLAAFPDAFASEAPASAVIVAAHPDDEVLGAGGLISVLAAAGARLRLVAITDGEGSHRGHAAPQALARRRVAETDAALGALGAGSTEVIRLGLPDTGLAGREDQLTTALSGLVAGFDVCLAPWDGDLHADHGAAGRAARRASSKALGYPVCLYYPVWMWHWASPGDPRVPWERAVRVPLPPRAVAGKHAAIACFASQLEDRGDDLGPVLSPAMTAHFERPAEVLLR